ncbi:hypothetical protein LWI28_011247 [Acer negundo]|uniref:Ubiquitin-like protease family profile domain-containing protein n=1 Tax=Acer negundo TaxID=4023 RepID=A0AAD5P6Z8_ACENE|nr:hypothetical protein LWI28_011247 [Acer negundo]
MKNNKNKNKKRKGELVEEEEVKRKVKGKGKGKEKEKSRGEEEKKDKKSKYYTYNLSGFPLVLQVPSTILELYAAMLDSEKRIIAFCRNEFAKIRKEMKGAEQDDEAVGDKAVGDKAVIDKEDIGGKDTGDKGVVEQDAEEQGKAGEEDDGSVDVDVGNKGVNGGEQEAVVDVVKRVKGGEEDEVVVEGFKAVGSTAIEGDGMVEDFGEKSILEEFSSPSVCFIAQNFLSSVVTFTEADHNVEYKDVDKQKARKRSRYLEIQYTNLMPMKTNKSKSNEEDIDIVEFTPFLKNGDQFSFYTGQIIPMTRQDFQDLVNVNKWISDLVLIPCLVPGHWLLCHVLLKEGKILVFDSFNDRKSGFSNRLKDIRGLLYLLPSMLKHVSYYQQMKMDPHATPFKAENLHSDFISQQHDGNSCDAFLMKYAELIMAGIATPWKSIFGQKNIKNISKAIAVDIYTNGQLRNSP